MTIFQFDANAMRAGNQASMARLSTTGEAKAGIGPLFRPFWPDTSSKVSVKTRSGHVFGHVFGHGVRVNGCHPEASCHLSCHSGATDNGRAT